MSFRKDHGIAQNVLTMATSAHFNPGRYDPATFGSSFNKMPDFDDISPLQFHPRPAPVSFSATDILKAAEDPMLCVTPERRPPVMQLHHPVSAGELEDKECSLDSRLGGRGTRVHFNQNVAVHHISPDSGRLSVSPPVAHIVPAGSDVGSYDELDLTNLSDSEPISVVASDLKSISLSRYTQSSINADSQRSLIRPSHGTSKVHMNVRSKVKNAAELSGQNVQLLDAESVVARRIFEQKSPSPLLFEAGINVDNRPATVTPLIVPEAGSTCGLSRSDMSTSLDSLANTDSCCVLSRPEMNSTLRVRREIANLREKEFDFSTAIKDKTNAKLKSKVVEKACSKLNSDSVMYPDLISLEVSESELLTRVADEQLDRVKSSDANQKEKLEGKISRVPDLMDFFSYDLHKESASTSLVGIPPLRIEPRTADLRRAFDLYKHIRMWEKLQ